MEERGYNPIHRLIDLAEELAGQDARNYDLEFKVHGKLLSHYAPMPKSVDINLQQKQHVVFERVDYTDYMESRKGMIPAPANGLNQITDISQKVVEAEIMEEVNDGL